MKGIGKGMALPVRRISTQQIILCTAEKLHHAGVPLTRATSGKLAINPRRFLALSGDDMQPALARDFFR
jgi:hypothetical protein